jgi:hypothetical protein
MQDRMCILWIYDEQWIRSIQNMNYFWRQYTNNLVYIAPIAIGCYDYLNVNRYSIWVRWGPLKRNYGKHCWLPKLFFFNDQNCLFNCSTRQNNSSKYVVLSFIFVCLRSSGDDSARWDRPSKWNKRVVSLDFSTWHMTASSLSLSYF